MTKGFSLQHSRSTGWSKSKPRYMYIKYWQILKILSLLQFLGNLLCTEYQGLNFWATMYIGCVKLLTWQH